MVCAETTYNSFHQHAFRKSQLPIKHPQQQQRQQRPKKRVRFDAQPPTAIPRSSWQSARDAAVSGLPDTPTWLSRSEYAAIRREVETTLERLQQQHRVRSKIHWDFFSARGLETFWVTTKHVAASDANDVFSAPQRVCCLKPEVRQRRKSVVQGVLHLQAMHQQHLPWHEQLVSSRPSPEHALREACLVQLGKNNALEAIERGLADWEQAREIYVQAFLPPKPKPAPPAPSPATIPRLPIHRPYGSSNSSSSTVSDILRVSLRGQRGA